MARRYDTVSFLSDFGVVDEFVGVVHSVIRDLAPHARVIDLTHGITPFDVRAGSLALARSIGYVASGVVLAVVDPGVASSRRAIAVEVADGEGVFVGPDNGLLAPAVAIAGGAQRVVELTSQAHQLPAPGATFAGRDVFAPAAAHLCNGVDLGELGEAVDPDLLLPGVVALPQADDAMVIAQVLWIDRYGNAQLNVGPGDLADTFGDHLAVRCGSGAEMAGAGTRSVRRATAYAELTGGAVGLVLDSYGMYALSMNQRSAAEELDLGVGDQVTLRPGDDEPEAQPVAFGTRPR